MRSGEYKEGDDSFLFTKHWNPRVVESCTTKALMIRLRRSDILRMTMDAMREDGIHVTPHKIMNTSGKRLIFEWTPELCTYVEEIQAIPPLRIGNTHLFVTRRGEPYINDDGDCNGFDSMWARFVKKFLDESKLLSDSKRRT